MCNEFDVFFGEKYLFPYDTEISDICGIALKLTVSHYNCLCYVSFIVFTSLNLGVLFNSV